MAVTGDPAAPPPGAPGPTAAPPPPVGLRRHVREGDLGKAGVALALATLTVLAAVVAGLQSHASTMAQQGRREADRIGLEATGASGSTVARIGGAYGVYRRWYEDQARSFWAADQVTGDEARPDRALLETLRDIDETLYEWERTQSALLQPPYYDPAIDNSDFSAFEADLLDGPSTRARQLREIEATVAAVWDAKASDYITVLTILAVGLFFLGLGATVGRRARRFLSIAGVTFGVAAAAWTLVIALGPVHRVPATAVEKLVESVAFEIRASQGEPGAAVPANLRAEFERAISRASEAVEIDPTYLAAYLRRADARLQYADTLMLSPDGQTELTNQLLRDAVADYRRYVEARPEDYSGWWNLGWAAYLQGDAVGSLDATNRAIALQPTQFSLYLNRTLALLAGQDEAAALADVHAAIELAARDSTDSAVWALRRSDFELGRLAVLRSGQAETLRSIQRELREAQVALRVRSDPSPAADAPELGAISIRPIEIGRYSNGTASELGALEAGDGLEAASAVGFRVTVGGTDGLAGRMLSARVWVDGAPRADYQVDLALGETPAAETTFELVNAYGRAGLDLDAGAYQLQLFVDGATRFTFEWTVTPTPDEPQYVRGAAALLEQIQADGFECEAPLTSEDGGTEVACSATDSDDIYYRFDVFHDEQDRITLLVLGTAVPSEDVDVAAQAALYFGYAFRLVYPQELAERAEAWFAEQGTAVNEVQLGGTTIRLYNANATSRDIDIY
jgi:tetratricopeptide (TPR) repeat protein